MSDHEKECRDCGIYFRNLQDLWDWRLIQTGICENCHKKEEREYMESKQRIDEAKNQPITIGDVWKHKIDVDYYVRIMEVDDEDVTILMESGENVVASMENFLSLYSFHKSAETIIAVGSVWRSKEDGELVYIESDDGEALLWNLNFSPLGQTEVYADDTKHFLSKYEFVRDKVAVAPEMSVAVGDIWQARCDGTKCKVVEIDVDDESTWVITQSVDDEDAVESDTLRDFFEWYRFVSKVEVVAGVKHGHYHKDVSQYKTMDIYAICKVWNAEPSGCTHHALKKLLHAGERGAKSKITDLEQAIESIEALIALEKMDIGGDS